MRLEYDAGAYFPGYITTTGGNFSFKDIDGFGVEWTNSGLVSAHIYNDDANSKFLIDLENDQDFEIRYYNLMSASYTASLSLDPFGTLTLSGNQKIVAAEIERTGRITIDANGAGADVRLEAADHIILESGKEEDGSIYFRANSDEDSYRFAKSGQTAIEGFLSFQSLTQDQTFTFPDDTGTIALTSGTIDNADKLDGQHGSYYQDASNLNAGTIPHGRISDIGDSQARVITFDNLEKSDLTADGQLSFDSSQGLIVYRTQQGTSGAATTVLDGWNVSAGANISISNLDAGSGGTNQFIFSVNRTNLDADLLDGEHGSYYRNASNLNAGTIPDARLPATISSDITGNADTVDDLHASSFIRSDTNDNVTGHTEWQDNYEIRLGNSADFRVLFNGTDTVFRNYAHSGGDIIFQGEDSGGNNENLLILDTSGSSGYVRLFQNNSEKLKTTSGGVTVTGTVTATTFSGNATTATTATNCSRSISSGNGLTGGGALTANRTLTVQAANNTINVGSSGISVNGGNVTAGNATNARIDHDTGNAWHRPVFIDDGKSSATNQRLKTDNASTIGFNPSTNQVRATTFVGGLSGNASTATTATNCSRSIGAGSGLTGGGALAANRTINVGAGTGITVNSNDVAVDSTVCRTNVNKSITGTYTFVNTPTCSNNLTVQNRIFVGSSDNGQAIEVDRSSSYNTHLYIGGWSSSNSNDIARIRCSNNLHIDSPANGAMYLNWYSKKLINFKGKFVGGDATAVFRANNGTTAEVGFGFGTDNDTGFYKTNNNRISISTGNAFRGFMSGGDFRYTGIYSNTTSGGTNVRVDSNGRLRRHSSSRRTKTNIEPMEVEYAYKILDQVQPIWYRPRVPDPEWPQAYLDSLREDEAPCISDCDAYCQDNEIDWEIGDKLINEGNNPDWSYWGFIAEDLAEIDPRLCQQNPETGEYDSVQYEEFTPLLLKIAQEQKKQITSLEERLSALEQKFSQCSACNPSV